MPSLTATSFKRDSSYPNMQQVFMTSTTSSSVPERRSDALSRAMEKKFREDRWKEREARRIARLEQERETTNDNEEEWKRMVRKHGPIMGRRTLSSGKPTDSHSWSYETLPPHIPLYPLPGLESHLRVKETVRNEQTGQMEEREVDTTPERKRLFIFGSGR